MSASPSSDNKVSYKNMNNQKHIPKLENKHKEWIISQLALKHRMDSSFRSIADLFKRVWNIDITLQTVRYYSDNYQDKIYEQRKALNREISEKTDIAHPIVQMKILEQIIDECMNPEPVYDIRGNLIPGKKNCREAREAIKLAAQISGSLVEKTEQNIKINDSSILRAIDSICDMIKSDNQE